MSTILFISRSHSCFHSSARRQSKWERRPLFKCVPDSVSSLSLAQLLVVQMVVHNQKHRYLFTVKLSELVENTIGSKCADCVSGYMRVGVLNGSSLQPTMPCIRYVSVYSYTRLQSAHSLSAVVFWILKIWIWKDVEIWAKIAAQISESVFEQR